MNESTDYKSTVPIQILPYFPKDAKARSLYQTIPGLILSQASDCILTVVMFKIPAMRSVITTFDKPITSRKKP